MKKLKLLSRTQLRLLHNIACGKHPHTGVNGQSAHGGFGQTVQSVRRRGLIVDVVPRDLDGSAPWKLTRAGAEAHRSGCCHRGTSPDDIIVEEVEEAMLSKSSASSTWEKL